MRIVTLAVLLMSSCVFGQSLPERQTNLGTSGDQMGRAVGSAGDVDGDGRTDFVVGSPFAGSIGTLVGSAQLISGADNSLIYSVQGSASNELFGESVSGAGDVDNDGTPDFIVGAPGHSSFLGKAVVYSGATGLPIRTHVGTIAGGGFGISVRAAGDVNADGFDDVMIASYLAGTAAPGAGQVDVFSGFDGTVIYTFEGDAASDNFGFATANVGDINNDGFDDLAVGARNHSSAAPLGGLIRVFSGANGSVLLNLPGSVANGKLGQAVAGAGDVNADGFRDIVAGSDVDPTAGISAGRVYVFSGQNGAVIHDVLGDFPSQRLGFAVAGGHDLNGDGRADFVAGAANNSLSGPAGMLRAYSGVTGAEIETFLGSGISDRLGWAAELLEDTNGDGFAEILAGAPLASPGGGGQEGEAKVYSLTGEQLYGSAAGTMTLKYLPGIAGIPAQGVLAISGAPLGTPMILGVSLQPDNTTLLGIPIFIDVFAESTLLIDLVPNLFGQWFGALSLLQPSVSGLLIYMQAASYTGDYSNGMQLRFTR